MDRAVYQCIRFLIAFECLLLIAWLWAGLTPEGTFPGYGAFVFFGASLALLFVVFPRLVLDVLPRGLFRSRLPGLFCLLAVGLGWGALLAGVVALMALGPSTQLSDVQRGWALYLSLVAGLLLLQILAAGSLVIGVYGVLCWRAQRGTPRRWLPRVMALQSLLSPLAVFFAAQLYSSASG